MSRLSSSLVAMLAALIPLGAATSADHDRYAVVIPGGLSFAEFRGYKA